MIKNLLFGAAILFLFACGSETTNSTQGTDKTPTTDGTPITLTVEEFSDKAGDFVDKKVTVEGTVVHVCEHSGKRIHIVGADPDVRLKIEAGGDVSQFDMELEGSKVKVNGVVSEMRVDNAYLSEWEDEVKAKHKPEDEEYQEDMERIADLRKEIADSGTDHLSFYSMEARDYKVIK